MNAPSKIPTDPFPTTPALPAAPDHLDLPLSGFEEPMSEAKQQVVELAHRFAREVLRPEGAALDRLTPEEVIASGSAYWTVLKRHKALGFNRNGMTRAYPMEKLLRDARAALIEDGCNEILAIKGGSLLADPALL